MRRAIELAARGLTTASPNPVVGCVVLDAAGEVAGEGWHGFAGGPHAEVVALQEAGERARGATAVVTLEPCSHTGRTGACTTALHAAGISRVVYAVDDPNPAARGGADVLRGAGIEVEGGLLPAEAERVNEAWLHAVRSREALRDLEVRREPRRPDRGRRRHEPLDHRRGRPPGRHRLRAQVDAILVGVGTVVADDPLLTVRPEPPEPAPSANHCASSSTAPGVPHPARGSVTTPPRRSSPPPRPARCLPT